MTALRNAAEIDRFLSRPDPKKPVILIYGPDSGLVSERVATAIRAATGGSSDPFSVIPLEGDAIAADPGLLADEAGTIGLFGSRRVIRVRAGGKNFAGALEPLLDGPPDSTIVIEGGDLRPTSPLRALCEKSPAAAAIPCYADSAKDLGELIDRMLAAANITIEPDARGELISLLGADRVASRAEIEKLILYVNGEHVRLDDVRAVIADASALALDDVLDSAATGEAKPALVALNKAYAAGTLPAAILNALIRHVASLHRLRIAVDKGDSPALAVKSARPPVFFRRQPKFERALSRFSTELLAREMVALSDAALAARKNAALAETITERAVLRLAKSGKQAGRR